MPLYPLNRTIIGSILALGRAVGMGMHKTLPQATILPEDFRWAVRSGAGEANGVRVTSGSALRLDIDGSALRLYIDVRWCTFMV